MLAKKHHPFIIIFNILIFAAAVILKPLESVIAIKTATPMLILPLLTAFSIFGSVYQAAVAGFLTGACLDSISSGAYCFNTLTLMLTAVAVTVCANNLFNKNIRSAAVISLLVCAVYFILKWIVFHAVGADMADSMLYLLRYALPSALYSAVLIFPFFYLYRHFSKVLNS
ncbi:MAG: rod shape-determining protein MreD [Clostridia bacterium]|nr:rod shape-determining protein MreD [Clostridia bacterium]